MTTESHDGESHQPHEPREVPEDLMRRLHDATQGLADARVFLDEVLDSPMGTLEMREKAAERLREAEGQIEAATEEVNRFLAS